MSQSKFAVGQTVEFIRSSSDNHVPAGSFTVTRVMPSDSPDRSYRVRSARDGLERVLTESQLRPMTGAVA